MVDIEKQNINILIVEKDNNPKIKIVPKTLKAFRNIIGDSNIEIDYYKKVLIVYNSEGLKNNLPITRYLDTQYGKKAIRGTFFLMGNDEQYGDFRDLTKEQIEEFTNEFNIEKEEEIEM